MIHCFRRGMKDGAGIICFAGRRAQVFGVEVGFEWLRYA